MNQSKTIKAYILLQIGLSLLVALLISYAATQKAAFSFLTGAFFSTLNVLFLIFIMRRLFEKKSFALTLVLILFKYSILGISLYLLITSHLLEMVWFVVGLSIILPSIIGFAFIYLKQIRADEVKNAITKQKRNLEDGSL